MFEFRLNAQNTRKRKYYHLRIDAVISIHLNALRYICSPFTKCDSEKRFPKFRTFCVISIHNNNDPMHSTEFSTHLGPGRIERALSRHSKIVNIVDVDMLKVKYHYNSVIESFAAEGVQRALGSFLVASNAIENGNKLEYNESNISNVMRMLIEIETRIVYIPSEFYKSFEATCVQVFIGLALVIDCCLHTAWFLTVDKNNFKLFTVHCLHASNGGSEALHVHIMCNVQHKFHAWRQFRKKISQTHKLQHFNSPLRKHIHTK